MEIAKTEPESEGDELLGSDGEMFEWSWEWRRNVRVKVYYELFDQLVESNAK